MHLTTQFVKQTTIASIIAQAIAGLIGVQGLFVSVTEEHKILKEALVLGMIVQVIELGFYISFVTSFDLSHMAAKRYFDWFLSTPLMLITMMLFLKYQERMETGAPTARNLGEFWEQHKRDVMLIVLFNFLMLLLGYLGEIGFINMWLAFTTSFFFFFATFYILYARYGRNSDFGSKIYWAMFWIWFVYGLVFLLPIHEKNVAFNILDIIAKNFFEVFLAYKINTI